jgi:23S rRNA pseudouridine1911/1915/1917 synthase
MKEPAFRNYHVTDKQSAFTLVAALRQFRPGDSWATLRRLVGNRHVEVNGTLCANETRKLKAGDVVKVWLEPRNPLPQPEDLRIRYLDRHIVVVEKPAGVTTLRHPEERFWPKRRKQFQPTLDEMLRDILARKQAGKPAAAAKRRRRAPFLRAVHRLDRDTSGLMVFALSPEAERKLVHMFRKHAMERVYLAIVQGRVAEQTFESHLVRDRGDGLRGSTDLPGVGRRAVTHVRPLQQLDGYTLIECRLQTGRTHQIRIHLAEAGHPVCGEKVYCRRRSGRALADRSGAPRQALHAAELGFNHPITGEPLHFEMPLPPDLSRLLARLSAADRAT